jgi:ABC-type sugar transport system permease subunit
LFRYNLKYPNQYGFIGGKNYVDVTQMYYFVGSLTSSVIFAVVAIPIILFASLALAMLAARKFRGSGFLQWLILVPWGIPYVVAGLDWKWLFDSNYGLINNILLNLGVIESYQPWLTMQWPAMFAIVISFIWVTLPLPTLLFLAGIQSIPQELYEASQVDGAGALARFRAITFTWLKPIFLIVVILTTLSSIQVFDPIYVITQGGPADFTAMITFYTFLEMFNFLDFGHASALAFMIFIVSIILIFAYFYALRMGRLRLRA